MRRIWIAAATVALLGFGAAVVTASEGGSGGRATPTAATTTEMQTTTTTSTTEDRPRRERTRERGRHGDDAALAPAGQPTRTTGVDVSGPCDEAEHASDPRCTGTQAPAGARDDDDHRGRGDDDRGDDDRGRGHDDDGEERDDSSGRGGNSGPGGGDED